MYLKSLTLKGFKSFADKTVFSFDKGLSVIVGPNGSGKSNVCDAIQWVLGEQSARTLRGQAMEDVIFSGSAVRRSVSVAEVTLVLDNTDHTLPMDFSEVSITRRLFRSGDSEYLIAGVPARLRDVQDILHDSGLGRQTHSIIGQGRLEDVLSGKPQDRRELIEEAADIAKHRRRLERSLKKLDAMEVKLQDVRVLQRELKSRMQPLERQAREKRRLESLKQELQELSMDLAADTLQQSYRRYEKLRSQSRLALGSLEAAKIRYKQKADHLEELRSALAQKGLFVGDVAKDQRRMLEALSGFEMHERILSDRMVSRENRLHELEQLLADSMRELASARTLTDGARGEQNAAETAFHEASIRLETDRSAAMAASGHYQDIHTRFRKLRETKEQLKSAADREILAYARLEESLKSHETNDVLFAGRVSELEAACEVASAEAARQDALAAAAREHVEELSAQRKRAEATLAHLTTEKARLEAGLDALRRELARDSERLKILEETSAQASEDNPLRAQIKEAAADTGAAIGLLRDLIDSDAQYDRCLEEYFAGDLEAPVLADVSAAAEILKQFAAGETPGFATLFVAGEMTVERIAGVPEDGSDAPGAPLTELLSFSGLETADTPDTTPDDTTERSELPSQLFSRLRLVNDIASALCAHTSAPAYDYLTPAGSMVLSDGRIKLGRRPSPDAGSLERLRQIRELSSRIPESQATCVGLEEKLTSLNREISRLQEDILEYSAKERAALADQAAAEAEARRQRDREKRLQEDTTALIRQRAEAAEAFKDAKAQASVHRSSARELEEQLEIAAQKLRRSQDELTEARQHKDETEATLRRTELSYERATSRFTAARKAAQDLEGRIPFLQASIDAYTHEQQNCRCTLRQARELSSRLRELKTAAAERLKLLDDRVQLAEADTAELASILDEAQGEAEAAKEAQDRAAEHTRELDRQLTRAQMELEEAVSRGDLLGLAVDQALDTAVFVTPEAREQARRRKESLEERIARSGPVNEYAVAEYAELSERFEHISAQLEDLTSARVSLEKIITAITKNMTTRFNAAFDEVNRNFSEVFGLLFRGGSAHLELTDPKEPATTGLEVIAQPRGKRITKMSLMSGGEKTLTALALLFAVYRVRTVPFYVFDEIEATLDDVNLSRLLGAIDRLKQDTQLIVVSHQRRTMETSDVLYGVTMGTDGVSHVISQKLERGA